MRISPRSLPGRRRRIVVLVLFLSPGGSLLVSRRRRLLFSMPCPRGALWYTRCDALNCGSEQYTRCDASYATVSVCSESDFDNYGAGTSAVACRAATRQHWETLQSRRGPSQALLRALVSLRFFEFVWVSERVFAAGPGRVAMDPMLLEDVNVVSLWKTAFYASGHRH